MPGETRRARDKMMGLEGVTKAVAHARRRGETIVFTNGCFDLLHVGHVRSLEAAAALGDRLVVAINHDASVRRLKGPERPLQSARVRKELVAALGCVDWVVGFGADTPSALIRRLRPDVLAKGGDWKPHEIVGRQDVESWGGTVERLPLVKGVSTTDTIAVLRRGDRA